MLLPLARVQGPNLLKLARKEQCLALLTQLRTKFKIDGYIYRVFPNGEVQYLHPKVRGKTRMGKRAGCSWLAGITSVAFKYRQCSTVQASGQPVQCSRCCWLPGQQ